MPPSPPAPPRPPETLEGIRADPVPERRLLRLQRFVRALPVEARAAYWTEARELARAGGDSARLLLVGFARRLPSPLANEVTAAVAESVRGVRDPGKRALAWLAMDAVAPLDADATTDARVRAQLVPHVALRIMLRTQLARSDR